MKKILSLFLIGMLCFTLVGCGNSDNKEKDNNSNGSDNDNKQNTNEQSNTKQVGNDDFGYLKIPNDWTAVIAQTSPPFYQIYDYKKDDGNLNVNIKVQKIGNYFNSQSESLKSLESYKKFHGDSDNVKYSECSIGDYSCYLITLEIQSYISYEFFVDNGSKSNKISIDSFSPITTETQNVIETYRFTK